MKQSIPLFFSEERDTANNFSGPTEKTYCEPPSPGVVCFNANIFGQHEMPSGESAGWTNK